VAKAKRRKDASASKTALIPVEQVARSILVIRGERVLLDADLAQLYGVSVKQLNQAIRRNLDRFPADFMFELSEQEFDNLRSQIVTSRFRGVRPWGGRRYAPYVFTEHGAVMLASVLRSETAVAVSVQVVRAFVRLRQLIAGNEKLRRKLARIERKLQDHDEHFAAVFNALRQLLDEDEEGKPAKQRIGYETESKSS
jgi:hypothetical protein